MIRSRRWWVARTNQPRAVVCMSRRRSLRVFGTIRRLPLRVLPMSRSRREPLVHLLRPYQPRWATACRRLFRNWLNIRRHACRYRLADLPLNPHLSLRTHRSRRHPSRPRRRIPRPWEVVRPNCHAAATGMGMVTVALRVVGHTENHRMTADPMDPATVVCWAVAQVVRHRTAVGRRGLAMVVLRAIAQMDSRTMAKVRRGLAMGVPRAGGVRIPCIPTNLPATVGNGRRISRSTRIMVNS